MPSASASSTRFGRGEDRTRIPLHLNRFHVPLLRSVLGCCVASTKPAMAASSRKREPRVAVEDLAEGTSSRSKLDAVGQVIMSPFSRAKHDSNKLLSNCTYQLLDTG
ncbi:hypothetical protein BDY19DRAFT_941825 [Irpex rosettiformis]|uniref:Uncharacterized protein n=1 Tax=Irpex rosettiformis TaxID=378272 RepID=A0ACB8U6S0_9APHY|nr:hypothetical protein BDY19DRAFT_941825 [Irpex rosettiformis]